MTATPDETPRPRFSVVPRMGQPGKNKWMFAAIWLIYLVGPIADVASAHRSAPWKLLNWVLVAGFIVGYCVLTFASYPRTGTFSAIVNRPRLQVPLVFFLAATATVTSLFVNDAFLGMWIYVGSGIGLSLPLADAVALRSLLAAVAGLTACSLIVGVEASEWFILVFPTFFAGVGTMGIRRMAVLIGELREAREQVARMAASEERLRLARDLHDLTGHSLSLITLKSELAQRMLERSIADAAAAGTEATRMKKALTELGDIEQVSRQTLVDIREAVSNYRRPTLAVELSSACAALNAAGVKLDAEPSVTSSSGVYDPEIEAVLAWCLREAVTNAIRHSGATKVRVRLVDKGGELELTVQNDGRGLAETAGCRPDDDNARSNGLRGLRERLDAVGGRLTVGGPDGDFRLAAAVPIPMPGSTVALTA